jgi:hypothetical protein
MEAGGISVNLHDIHGNHPRVSLINPNFSGRNLKQVLGRVWRDGGKTPSVQRIMFAANTIEEKIATKLKQKLINMDIVNDGFSDEDVGEGILF